MQFGIDGHGEAEGWLLHGTTPDQSKEYGRLAADGIPFLPKPGTCHVEIGLDGKTRVEGGPPGFVEIWGVPYVGYLDVLTVEEGEPLVIDHKFTGRPEFALTVDTLRKDEQGIMYPFFASLLLPGSAYVRSSWIYYPRGSKRKVFPVKDRRSVQDIHQAFAREIHPRALQLHQIKQAAPTGPSIAWVNQALPCDPGACDFTGVYCDFANHCSFRNE